MFESTTTLHRRLDQTHYQTASDLLRQEIANHPEYENYRWELHVEEFADGTAFVRIRVGPPRIISPVLWFFILSLIALAWIYFGG